MFRILTADDLVTFTVEAGNTISSLPSFSVGVNS